MIKILLLHHWKSTWRSPDRGKNIFSAILFSALIVVLSAYCFIVGLFLPELFEKIFPKQSAVIVFNHAVLYIVAISFFLRTIIQGIPSQAIDYYRLLPVRRESLINTLLVKVFLNEINIAFLIFMIPFTLKTAMVEYPVLSAISWFISIVMIEFSNGYFAFYLKKKFFSRPSIIIPIAVIAFVVIMSEIFTSVSVGYYSSLVFGLILTNPFFVILPIMLFVFVYAINYRHLMIHFYPEDLNITKKAKVKSLSRYSFFENFGELGSYIALELKMIFRNKRPRAMFFYSFLFIVYPSLTYNEYFDHKNEVYPRPGSIYETIDTTSVMNRRDNLKVTFNVVSDVPNSAFVYIRGSNATLGSWKPNLVNFYKQKNGTWSRTFYFEKGTIIGYQFTLGSEETKAIDDSRKILDKSFLTLLNDTTVAVKIPHWQAPSTNKTTGFLIVFWSIFIVSAPSMLYGQYIFSWDGNYFDFLLAHKVDLLKYVYAKYFVMTLGSLLFYVLTLPYIYINTKVFWFHSCALLFSIGYVSIASIFLGMFNKRRMDLSASMMSYQGREGGVQFLRGIIFVLLIGWIYFVVNLVGAAEYVFYSYALVGIVGIIFNKKLVTIALKLFVKKRYKMAVGFRQS